MTSAIVFADDLIIMTRGKTVTEAENFMNLELTKVQKWAQNNRLVFNENKSKGMLLTRRKRKEKKEIAVYINNKKLNQVNQILFDNKLTFREHINQIEEKCTKLIFSLARSAKVIWGLKHKALKTIYTRAILPIILCGAPIWNDVMKRSCYKAKIVRIQRLINIKIAKAYRTVSNEALCVITGLMPINLKIEEATKLHEMTKAEGTMYDRAMDIRNWVHPSKHITIIEGQEKNTHSLQVYTDGSKNEESVGSGIAVVAGTNLITTQMYRLNGCCQTIRPNSLQF